MPCYGIEAHLVLLTHGLMSLLGRYLAEVIKISRIGIHWATSLGTTTLLIR